MCLWRTDRDLISWQENAVGVVVRRGQHGWQLSAVPIGHSKDIVTLESDHRVVMPGDVTIAKQDVLTRSTMIAAVCLLHLGWRR